jgi:hypothetical protein
MRNREAEREMLASVYLRNVIAKCVALNKKFYRVAAMPEVGIFWMSSDGRSFFKKSVSIRDAEDYGEFKIFDNPHFIEWDEAIRDNPQWSGMEYDEVPRGRVVLHVVPGDNRFIIYLPKQLRRFARKIARAFNIPSSMVDFDYDDIHYKMD